MFKNPLLISVLLVTTTGNAAVLPCSVDSSQPLCTALGKNPVNWEGALPPSWQPVIPPVDVALSRLTEEHIKELIQTKKADFKYLRDLELQHKLPIGTLRTMWLIESVAGTLNVTNKSQCSGHFQFSRDTAKYVGLKNPFDLIEASNATVTLLHKYATLSGLPLNSTVTAYGLHQQGGNGYLQIKASGQGEVSLTKTVCRNLRKNIPIKYKDEANALKCNTQLAQLYLSVWGEEVNRILTIVLSTDL